MISLLAAATIIIRENALYSRLHWTYLWLDGTNMLLAVTPSVYSKRVQKVVASSSDNLMTSCVFCSFLLLGSFYSWPLLLPDYAFHSAVPVVVAVYSAHISVEGDLPTFISSKHNLKSRLCRVLIQLSATYDSPVDGVCSADDQRSKYDHLLSHDQLNYLHNNGTNSILWRLQYVVESNFNRKYFLKRNLKPLGK